jgi:uncharacterized protein YraI
MGSTFGKGSTILSDSRSIRTSFRSVARGWQRVVILAVVLAIAFGAHIPMPQAAVAASYESTANLNIRAEPQPGSPVIGGIPSGGTVEVTGEAQNGFYPVTYNGVTGYASVDYLVLAGSDDSGDSDPGNDPVAESGPTGTRYVEVRLNLRSGPATSYGVVAIMPAGAAVELTGQVTNGFSQLTWNGSTSPPKAARRNRPRNPPRRRPRP